MQTELLEQYGAIEQEFKLLQEKKEELRDKILSEMKANRLEKVESESGKFTVSHKVTYKYTEAVAKISDRLKLAQLKEQQKGLATKVESEYLLFTKPKTL